MGTPEHPPLVGLLTRLVRTYRDVDPTVHEPLTSTLAELAGTGDEARVTRGLTEADVARYIVLGSGETPPQPPTRGDRRPGEGGVDSLQADDT